MKLKVAFLTLFIVIFTSISTNRTINADDKDNTLGKRRNQVLITPELINDKTIMRDAKTGVKVAECMDKYNPYKTMNKKVSDDDILAKAEQKVACARTDDYNGACWVQSVGFVDGAYRVKICNSTGINLVAGSADTCKTLKGGETNGLFSAVSKNLGLEDIMYQGEYDDSPTACPTDVNNINALGYNYIEEATDPKYKDADDFYVNYCEPLAQRFYAGKCLESSLCPCNTTECKKNGFMPDVNSSSWRSAPSNIKECYQCHKTARAIRFYCQKVYNCIHNNKVNPVIKNLTSLQNRQYLKYLYGRGNYLCGYFAGQLCGCAKTKLVGGPRHLLRIARADNIPENKCDAEDTLLNPQCNLFDSKIYVRQFYNDPYKDTINDCPRDHDAEFGYQHRGTFFFPKMIVKSGEHERKVSLDYNVISHDATLYFNTPIGTPSGYEKNDTLNVYTNSKNDNIIFSHFYPVVFTIGNSYMTKNQDVCETKYTNQVDFFVVRFEYNITTDSSSLVAYSITPSSSKYAILNNTDGSIARFTLTREQFNNAFRYSEIAPDKYKKVNGILYSYDGNNSVKQQTLKNDARYYVFENIGSVIRPPIKYTYDGTTPYIVSPIVIDQDRTSLDTDGDPYATKIMIKLIPANLKALNNKEAKHPEFEYDINLPPAKGLNVNVAGFSSDAINAMGANSNKGTNNNALLYFKRFTVDYTTSCKYLLSARNATFDTTKPEDNYTACDDTSKYKTMSDKMNCLTLSLLSQECQGYINCLYTNTSIADCQNNDRKPKIKLYGNNLDDYKVNTDFRSKTYICLTNGFEFADRINPYGNVKLFGSFGNSKYDYTVRYQRQSTSKNMLSYPTRPITKRGRNKSVNEINEPLDDPRYIVPVFQKYFENNYDDNERKFYDLLNVLKSSYKISEETNRNTDITLLEEYAGDCSNNPELCRNRFQIAHRLIDETQGNLCIESSGLAGGTWDLPPRDFDTDYHIYIPLRCQYIDAKLYGAGGAGFTTESNSNCIIGFSTYKHEVRTYPPIGPPAVYWFTVHYRTIPKYDATGGGGGYSRGVIDINKMKVFDGYLNVSIGSATNFVRYILEKHNRGHKCYEGTGRNEMAWGQEADGPWVVIGGSHKYWNTHYDINGYVQEGRYNKDKMIDYDRGNSMLSFNSYGLSKPPSDAERKLADIQNEIITIKTQLDNANTNVIESKASQLYRYRILEYYFVSLYYAIQRLSYVAKSYDIAKNNIITQCYNALKGSSNIKKEELTLSQCSSYAIDNTTKEEIKFLLSEINKSYTNEYKSWYVGEDKMTFTGNDGTKSEVKMCESVEGRNVVEEYNYCHELQYASSFDDNISSLNTIINDIKQTSYYDKIKDYISNLSNVYTIYKTKINDANTYKDNKNSSYAKNKSVNTDKTSLVELETMITDMKANFLSVYNDAYNFANNNGESAYKNKLSNLKALYEKCNNDTHFNKYYPVYMSLSKLLFPSYSSISKCYSQDTEYCETNTIEAEGKTYTNAFDDNKHDKECNIVNSANSYFNDNNEGGEERFILHRKEFVLQGEIEELLQSAQNNIMSYQTALSDQENIINLNSNNSSNSIIDNITMLIKAFRGGSPIDYRIEKKQEYGPRYQNNHTNDVTNLKYTRSCTWCFDTYHSDDEYFIDELFGGLSKFRYDLDKTRSDRGYINTDFEITSGEYRRYSSDERSGFQAERGSGSNVAPREHIQGEGGSGWDRKYIVNASQSDCGYNSKTGCGVKKNKEGIGDPDGTFWANGRTNLGFTYQSTKSNLSNNKYNLWQGDSVISNGGAFWHRTSTASGGRGHSVISVGDILIEYKENSTNGSLYPVMDATGKKVFATGSSKYKSSQCVIRCPPIYVKVLLRDFLFEDNSTADLNVICEYTGTPTEDMEITNGSSVSPNKCYIISDYIHPVYGNLKGKIIRRMGFCPIAKCELGTWSLTEITGVSDDLFQYDRKAMLCKYRNSYDNVKNKQPWYFHMAFDSNIYASMAFKGGLGTSLDAELLENGRSYQIASCADNVATDFIEDIGTQLESANLTLYCKNGFWFSKVVKDASSNYTLYPNGSKKQYSTQKFTESKYLKANGLSKTPYVDFVEEYDKNRNEYYAMNNADMYAYEYLIKNIATQKTFGNSTKTSTGIESMKNAGREIFRDKIYCPPIIDLYDFDKTYSGNASWPETKEHSKVYGICKNKEGDITQYFQSPKGQPYRTCMRNGMWGPVFNSCLQGCVDEEKNGTLWSISQLGDNLVPDKDNKVIVYGACSGNYLNSQNLITTTAGRASRKCNLNTGNWEAVQNEGGCNDTLGCPIDNMKEDSVVVPFIKLIDVQNESNLWYVDIVQNIKKNPDRYKPDDYLSYDESLYLMFEDEKQDCTINGIKMKCLVGDNKYLDVSYEIKDLSPSENNSIILDNDGNRIIRTFENNLFIVLKVKNTFKPDAYNYMKNAKDNRNAFLSIYNWIYDLKDVNKNYTGQWSWDSCNLSVNSKLIYSNNNTSNETQENYKNSSLVILIPVLDWNNSDAQQRKKQAKMVAMFSPRLASQYYSLNNEELPQDERNILFRIPERIPAELQLPIIDPIPIIASTPFRNKRVYDIELKKSNNNTTRGDYYSWTKQEIALNEHTPDRDCYGKYIGYIHHNTLKHIFYTPHPTSQDKYFISAFCYDGHIFGYKAFQVGFTQLTDLSDEGCFLKPTSNGDNSAQKLYNYMNNKYPDAVEKDTQAHTMELNAYIAKMAGKYWSLFLQPEGSIRELFVDNYSRAGYPGQSIYADDNNIKYVLEQYEKGSKGYYYRVVPTRFEWISNNDLYTDTIKVHNLLKLDDVDPYCDKCEHTDADNINTEINGNVWKMCEV